jgi:hypothetical protein
MTEPGASTCFLDPPAEITPATLWRLEENGFATLACRDTGENSNGATVNPQHRSKLLQPCRMERVKSSPPPRTYLGVTPKVCSKRLT